MSAILAVLAAIVTLPHNETSGPGDLDFWAVSYTHLDVYKRQAGRGADRAQERSLQVLLGMTWS